MPPSTPVTPPGGDTDEAFATLRRGASSPEVDQAQSWLRQLGYLDAHEVRLGPGTEAALRDFQSGHLLNPTGELDYATWMILGDVAAGATARPQPADDEPPAVTVATAAWREVRSADGERYRQYPDGSVARVSASGGLTHLRTGSASWRAATDAIGPYPGGAPVSVEEPDEDRPARSFAPRGPFFPHDPPTEAVVALRRAVQPLPERVRAKVEPVLWEAACWVGVREQPKGSNDGPEVGLITRKAPMYQGRGPPWCAYALCTWIVRGLDLPSHDALPWGFRNGRALYFGAWAERMGRLLPAASAAPPGAIYVMYRDGSGSDAASRRTATARWDGAGHTGLVVEDRGGSVLCIDGNVSDSVQLRERDKGDLLGFVRWW